jgi:hypothetical protein
MGFELFGKSYFFARKTQIGLASKAVKNLQIYFYSEMIAGDRGCKCKGL